VFRFRTRPSHERPSTRHPLARRATAAACSGDGGATSSAQGDGILPSAVFLRTATHASELHRPPRRAALLALVLAASPWRRRRLLPRHPCERLPLVP
jgi:hypothetical protein